MMHGRTRSLLLRANAIAPLRKRHRFLKSVAVVVTAAFLGLTLQPLAIAARLPDAPKRNPIPAAPSNEERLSKHLDTLKDRLDRFERKLEKRQDVRTEQQELKTLRTELDQQDREALADFDRIGQHIKDKHLPPVIQQRHDAAVKQYKQEMALLKANLDEVDSAKDDNTRKTRAKRLKDQLTKANTVRTHDKFDPARLPFHKPDGKFRRTKSTFLPGHEGIKVAALNGVPSGLLLPAALMAAPTPADLAETVEVQLTPEIRALAQGLQTPVAMYEFVRNGFAFEPYTGSLKGAALTLKERGGNDWDLAALLISLYRAAGIPARYAVGTVEIPIEQAMNWLGVDDPRTAANLLASTGRNGQAVVSGGKVVAVRSDRVWVRAFVPYNHHRGAKSGPGDTWVDVDPSFKLHEVTRTLEPVPLPAFDQGAYLATLRVEGALDFHKGRLQTYLDTNNPGYVPEAYAPLHETIPEQIGYLIGQLPYKTLSVAATYSSAPNTVRQQFTLAIQDSQGSSQLSHAASLTELLEKRLTLSYAPATAADAQTIAAHGGLYQTPPYLIALKPQLKLEGQVVAEGAAIGAAQEQALEFHFDTPNGTDTVRNTVISGEYYAIALNAYAGSSSHQEVLDRARHLESIAQTIDLNDITTIDERLGELLYLAGRVFHHKVNAADRKIATLSNVIDVRGVSEMMYFLTTRTTFVFGIPRTMTVSGVTADFDRNVHLVMPVDGDAARIKPFMQLEGNQSSYFEHATIEKILGVQALSAVKALQIARDQQVPVHTVTVDNASALLPTLQVSAEVKADIQSAIHQGWQAITPARNLTLADWSGVGYILQNPENGEGYYRIAGGYNGAVTLAAADTRDRINNLTGGSAAEYAILAADRNVKCYPGVDRIMGTSDDSCFPVYLQSEAERLDGRTTGYYDANPYNYDITEVDLIRPVDREGALLTKYVKADEWRSQEGAEYMRAGRTIIQAIGEIMKQLKATGHGISSAGSGYRTRQRQKELSDAGVSTCGGRIPGDPCLRGHHLDGTAADIHLTGNESGGPSPIKLQVLCMADFLIGYGEVLHEGSAGTVHIAKPAKHFYRDSSGIRKDGSKWSWGCGLGAPR